MSKKKKKYKTARAVPSKPEIGEEDWRVLNERIEEMYPEIQTIWRDELKPEIEKLWKNISPWMGKETGGEIFHFHKNGKLAVRLTNIADFFVIMSALAIIKARRK